MSEIKVFHFKFTESIQNTILGSWALLASSTLCTFAGRARQTLVIVLVWIHCHRAAGVNCVSEIMHWKIRDYCFVRNILRNIRYDKGCEIAEARREIRLRPFSAKLFDY